MVTRSGSRSRWASTLVALVLCLGVLAQQQRAAEAFEPVSTAAIVTWTAADAAWASSVGISGATLVGGGAAAGVAAAGTVVVIGGAAVLVGWGIFKAAQWAFGPDGDPETDPGGEVPLPTRLSYALEADTPIGEFDGPGGANSYCYGAGEWGQDGWDYSMDCHNGSPIGLISFTGTDLSNRETSTYRVGFERLAGDGAQWGTMAANCRTEPNGGGYVSESIHVATWSHHKWYGNPGVTCGNQATTDYPYLGSVEITWNGGYYQGQPLFNAIERAAISGGDPAAEAGAARDRRIDVNGNCRDATSGTVTPVSASSPTYHLGDTLPLIPGVVCPLSTQRLTDFTATRVVDGDPDADLDLLEYQVPPSHVDPNDPNAECLANAAIPCIVMLYQLQPDGLYRTCDVAGYPCAGWAIDPNRTSKYQCRWGDIVVELTECLIYERTWEQGDPDEGQTQPQPGTNPDTDPAYPDVDPSQEQTPGLVESGCAPKWWHVIAPWTWMKAIGCALKWAFVPSAATKTKVVNLASDMGAAVPFVWLGDIGSWVAAMDDVTEVCWNVGIDAGTWGGEDMGNYSVVDTCGSNPVFNALDTWRPLISLAFYGMLFLPLGWWAWKAYAPGSTGVA